ncbi:transcriptional regulator, LacI family [Coriobacterium glomerans PW2]|uniref:Transcriptional regulator, LacI family n=1 Tax=Coriobacterium glomerans (strain ATCC 49209 / DSM 20642 / JCM 10262 / PW2) TaxID=700015 RepID=F2NBB7_CORGP|nr:LacI family DNA-binding transcriptional regulator [Coriobacterium glomerans]AEB06653.1 transcriptional regulator, LacI family [Coriobacterium glomerans PW2]
MTIYDIAQRAGVSIATVSRVVNGSSKVRDETRQRVLSIIAESGYLPNAFARGLGTDSMKTVGLVCADIAHPFMAHAVSYLERALQSNGYDCILVCSDLDGDYKRTSIQRLLAKRIDALILISSKYEDAISSDNEPDYVADAARCVPVFVINGRIPGDNVYCTFSTDFDIVREITASLIRSGRKRILFLSDAPRFVVLRRLKGYEQALRDAKKPIDPTLQIVTRNEIAYTEQMLVERVQNGLNFDAVVASEDDLAIAAIKFAAHTGKSIPEDLEIYGFNNTPLASSCEPELTSVDNQLELQCAETVRNLLAVLNGETDILQARVFPAQIVKRQTTR